MDEIQNKIATSGLVNFDLEKLYDKRQKVNLDITPWLWEGMIIKEKLLKEHLQNHDWSQYQNKLVYITCKNDAIVPNWAYMMLAKHLEGISGFYYLGSLQSMEELLFLQAIDHLDLTPFEDARVLVKGCSDTAVPANAYVHLSQKLIPVVKSLMFGEACSNVPIYKK